MFNKFRKGMTYLALMIMGQYLVDDFDSFSSRLTPYLFFMSEYLQERSKINTRNKTIYGIYQT